MIFVAAHVLQLARSEMFQQMAVKTHHHVQKVSKEGIDSYCWVGVGVGIMLIHQKMPLKMCALMRIRF